MEQIEAALGCGVATLYVDFEDIRRYRDAVALVRERGGAQIFLATPRIRGMECASPTQYAEAFYSRKMVLL